MKSVFKIGLLCTVFIPFFTQTEIAFYIHNQYKDPIYVKVNDRKYPNSISSNEELKIDAKIKYIEFFGIKTKAMISYQSLGNDLKKIQEEAQQSQNNTKICHLTILPTSNIFQFKENNLIEWANPRSGQSLKQIIEEAAQSNQLSAQAFLDAIVKYDLYGKETSMQLSLLQHAQITGENGYTAFPYNPLRNSIDQIQKGTIPPLDPYSPPMFKFASSHPSFEEKIKARIALSYDIMIFGSVYKDADIEIKGKSITDETKQIWIQLLEKFASPWGKQQYNNYIAQSNNQ